jgi:alcohol oxidase
LTAFTVYPESRGHIHITGTGSADLFDFKPGFFSDPEQIDIQKHIWVYKKQREIARRMNTYRGEVSLSHPSFEATSAARCVELDEPLEAIQDIEYTLEDDAVIEQWLRMHVGSTWHSLGTCKMAPLDELGVVDAALAVHGIKGLKIADLSVVPVNIAANTNNLALVIGEKASDIFIQELSLGRPEQH